MANNIAILQAYQASLLAEAQGGPFPGTEIRMITDYVLRMVDCVAQNAGKVMAFSVVTHRHLWLGLAEMSDQERRAAMSAPISPSGLFGTVEGLAQRLERQRLQAEAVQALMPRRDRRRAPCACPYADLISLAQGPAWVLPLRRDLLSQAGERSSTRNRGDASWRSGP